MSLVHTRRFSFSLSYIAFACVSATYGRDIMLCSMTTRNKEMKQARQQKAGDNREKRKRGPELPWKKNFVPNPIGCLQARSVAVAHTLPLPKHFFSLVQCLVHGHGSWRQHGDAPFLLH